MISFQVSDMTCGHCASTITQAVKAFDEDATVRIDLAAHRIDIQTPAADAAGLASAIQGAGYTPIVLAGGGAAPAPVAPAQRGGCCSR